MKFKKIIPIMLLAFLLASCGKAPGDSETPSEPEVSESEETPSEPDTPSEPETPSEPDTPSESEPEPFDAEDALGSKEALKATHDNLWEDASISAYTVKMDKKTSYAIESKVTTASQRDNEVVINEDYTKLNSSEEVTEDYELTQYSAIFGDEYYGVKNYVGETNKTSSVNRYKIVETPEYEDECTSTKANQWFTNTSKNLGSTISLTGFKTILSLTTTVAVNWDLAEDDGNYMVYGKLVQATTTIWEHTFTLLTDSEGMLTNLEYGKAKYNTADYDTESYSPVESAQPTEQHAYVISNISYEDLGETTTPTIDVNKYFLSSITTLGINNSFYQDDGLVYSEDGTLFAGEYFNPSDLDFSDATYAPTTAMDTDLLRITSSTNPDFFTADTSGGYTVTNTVGASTTITLGNSFISNLFETTLTSVGKPAPVVSTPEFNEHAVCLVLPDNMSNEYGILTVSGTVGQTLTVFVSTTNSGPFNGLDELGWSISVENPAVASASFTANQATALGQLEMDTALAIDLTLIGETIEAVGVFIYDENNDTQFGFGIVVSITGGEEPTFNTEVSIPLTIEPYAMAEEGILPLTGSAGDTISVIVPTANEGPFEGLAENGWTVTCDQVSVATVSFAENQEAILSPLGNYSAVVLNVTILSATGLLGNALINVYDSAETEKFSFGISVTIEADEDAQTIPEFEEDFNIEIISKTGSATGTFNGTSPYSFTLSGCAVGDKYVLGLWTSNEGPFADLGSKGYTFFIQNSAVASLTYSSQTPSNNWLVLIEVEVLSLGTTNVTLKDPTWGDTVCSFALILS